VVGETCRLITLPFLVERAGVGSVVGMLAAEEFVVRGRFAILS